MNDDTRNDATMKRIINIDDIALHPRPPEFSPDDPATADKYAARMAMIGTLIGAEQLGYNITVIPPGRRAFPYHNHRVNEEMFFILEGEGELRYGGERHAVRKGDFVACPAGGPETAHQFINTGSAELKILCVSTRRTPEICEYPDSGKFGLMAAFPSHADGRQLLYVARESDCRDYWEGE